MTLFVLAFLVSADPCARPIAKPIEPPVNCEPLGVPQREESVASWRALRTDAPTPRPPSGFKYLVSAMNLEGADLVRDARGVRLQRPVIFASLIDPYHTMTFDNSGIILEPEVDQVAVAVPYDTTSTWCEQFATVGRLNRRRSSAN